MCSSLHVGWRALQKWSCHQVCERRRLRLLIIWMGYSYCRSWYRHKFIQLDIGKVYSKLWQVCKGRYPLKIWKFWLCQEIVHTQHWPSWVIYPDLHDDLESKKWNNNYNTFAACDTAPMPFSPQQSAQLITDSKEKKTSLHKPEDKVWQ